MAVKPELEPRNYLDFELTMLYREMGLQSYTDLAEFIHDQVSAMLGYTFNAILRDPDPMARVKREIEECILRIEEIENKAALVSERSPQHRVEEVNDFSDTVVLFRRWSYWAAPLVQAREIDSRLAKKERRALYNLRVEELRQKWASDKPMLLLEARKTPLMIAAGTRSVEQHLYGPVTFIGHH